MDSIRDLFATSWQSFKTHLLNIFLINLYMCAAVIFLTLIAGVIAFVSLGLSPSIFNNFSTFDWPNLITSISVSTWALIGLMLLAISLVTTALSYAQISLIGSPEPKSLSYHLHQGFVYLWPLIVLDLISGFLFLGNFLLFILPGIAVGILLSWAGLEVILNHKRGREALIGSATIVSQHFDFLFARVLIIFVFQSLIQNFIPNLLEHSNSNPTTLSNLYHWFANPLSSWFTMVYIVELYKQVRDKTDWTKPVSINWMWFTAILGFILIVVAGFYLVPLILSQPWFKPGTITAI